MMLRDRTAFSLKKKKNAPPPEAGGYITKTDVIQRMGRLQTRKTTNGELTYTVGSERAMNITVLMGMVCKTQRRPGDPPGYMRQQLGSVVWSYCVRRLRGALHARELPLVSFRRRPLAVLFRGILFPVPDHPRLTVVLPSTVVVDHNGLFDLDLHVEIAGGPRIEPVFSGVELGPHGVGDVARGGKLVSDDDSPLSAILGGLCKERGKTNNHRSTGVSVP